MVRLIQLPDWLCCSWDGCWAGAFVAWDAVRFEAGGFEAGGFGGTLAVAGDALASALAVG